MYKVKWPNLREILPADKIGSAEIKHFEVTQEDSKRTALRVLASGVSFCFVQEGQYTELVVDNNILMSDTDMEIRSNGYVAAIAHGNVLVAGLGIGLVIIPMCKNPVVKSVTVIEKNKDVIKLVEPHIRHKKLEVIHADIFDWKPENGRKWDIIWFDIWHGVNTDNLSEIARLHQKFKFRRNRENPGSFMSSWMVEYLRDGRRKERESGWS
jgi:predicted membrane-bound spermidine synthase